MTLQQEAVRGLMVGLSFIKHLLYAQCYKYITSLNSCSGFHWLVPQHEETEAQHG